MFAVTRLVVFDECHRGSRFVVPGKTMMRWFASYGGAFWPSRKVDTTAAQAWSQIRIVHGASQLQPLMLSCSRGSGVTPRGATGMIEKPSEGVGCRNERTSRSCKAACRFHIACNGGPQSCLSLLSRSRRNDVAWEWRVQSAPPSALMQQH